MTTNQIAYQANKLREEENAIKRKQADIAQQAQDIKLSEHIHEYGMVNTPKDQFFLGGQKVWKDMSQVAKNVFSSAGDFLRVLPK